MWLLVVCLVCARVVLLCVRPRLVVGLVAGAGRVVCPGGLLGCCPCVFSVCAYFVRVRVGFVFCLWGVGVSGVYGERGCLGAGCVVAGGGLPVWLGDAVAGGGVSVGFDVGLRVFVLSGAGVPVFCGSASVVGVRASGSVVEDSASGGSVSSSDVPVSVPVDVAGGVAVCVPCARAVFGDGWCSLVLRRWASAAGVDGAKVDALLGSAPGSVSSSLLSARSLADGGGRVGAGFGARVRDWGARVGVGGGVVSGGGVVAGWWEGVVGSVRALVSGVGVKGLVLAGLVGVVVLVSVLVLVG